ncbi:MAG: SpoIIE family protein phosphatase [Methylococcaceae bacterium]|nr:SpoIIE family protein phosphatase [Methylococcaceae bacterium]
MRILIVENDLLMRTMLEKTLRKFGYEIDIAFNSNDALQLLLTKPIQFVVTNWVLSGGDGPSLCRAIRALDLPYYTYIILVTSFESTESLIEGLGAGADDFIRKPMQLNELHARIRAGERVLALEKTLNERNAKLGELNANLMKAHELINNELKMAAKMQWELLPPPATKYLDISIDWLFCPSYLMSGDLFNFLRLDETHVGFYSLDVAGHGVSAAMMSFSLFSQLTSELQRGSPLKRKLPGKPHYQIVPPAAVMAELNSQFHTDANSWLYFTMVYGIVDTTARTIELTQAGHPNPIYIAQHEAARFIGDGGFPIGLTDIAEYDSIVVNYNPGDRIVLYSDGITECVGVNGEMFGCEQLLEFFDNNRDISISEVSKALNKRIQEWRGRQAFDDDISMLILALA